MTNVLQLDYVGYRQQVAIAVGDAPARHRIGHADDQALRYRAVLHRCHPTRPLPMTFRDVLDQCMGPMMAIIVRDQMPELRKLAGARLRMRAKNRGKTACKARVADRKSTRLNSSH